MSKFDLLKNAVCEAAEALGIAEYELYFSESSSISTKTYRDEIAAFSSSVGGSLLFRCIVDGKMGYASTQLMEVDEVKALVARAAENSRMVEKDDPAIIFGGASPDQYGETEKHPFEMPGAAKVKQVAMDCRNVLYAADPRMADGSECGAYGSESTIRLYNSKGLDLSNHVGNTGAYMYAVLDNGEEKKTGSESEYNCLDSLDMAALADTVVKKTEAKFGAGTVKTGKTNIVFDTRQMNSMLSTFVSVFYAENVQKGLSLLKDKVGTKIAADCVTITDNPFQPGNTMQIAFDGEGVPTRTKTVVEKGELKTLLYNLTSAQKDGVESTGNASRNGSSIGTRVYTFTVAPGTASREDLLEKAGEGIFVTEMKGFHAGANGVTGDFSIESGGFLIENGKLGKPVKSFTIAGNFFELLKSIEEVGSEMFLGGPGYTQIACPDVLVRNMSVAGE